MHSSGEPHSRVTAPRTLAATAALPRLSVLAISTAVAYLVWRVVATRSDTQPALFWLLLTAEAFGVARLAIELVLIDGPAPARTAEPPPEPVATDVIVVVDDESLEVLRTTLLAARCVRDVETVAVIDTSQRSAVADLVARLGLRYLMTDLDDVASCATAAAASFRGDVIVVVGGDRVLLPDAAAIMAGHLRTGSVDAVSGTVEEANAVRRVDRSGLGDAVLWERRIVPRLSRAGALTEWGGVALVRRAALVEVGGFATADGVSLSLTAARLVRMGHGVVACDHVVARRLAAGPGPLGLHRYSRELHTRLRRLRARPRAGVGRLDGLAAWSALVGPLRAVQRLVLLAVAWCVLLGVGTPVSVSLFAFAAAWSARTAIGLGARFVACGDARFEPWIVNDLRVMTCDLAVGVGVLRSSWRPPRVVDRPPGARWLRPLPRLLRSTTAALIAAVLTGFVRVRVADSVEFATMASCSWFLTGAMLASRSVRRRQFRSSYRTDDEIPVVEPEGVRVVGLSLVGFDVLTRARVSAGDELAVVVDLPRARGERTPTLLAGRVQRAVNVGEGHVAYVRFTPQTLDVEDRLHEYLAVSAFELRHGLQLVVV